MADYRVVTRATRDLLGEGPTWSATRGALFWVDIIGQALNRLTLDNGAIERWDMPERIGWAIEREGRDDLLIGLRSGVAELTLDPFAIERVSSPEPDRPQNRLNDAKVDAAGRIWTGTKSDDAGAAPEGALYRLDPGFAWSRHDDGYGVTNGPTFSADGNIFYHTDSDTRTIYAFDFAADGNLSNRRVWLRFEDAWGYPDGMTTDAEDHIWVAHWGGGRITRFRPDATIERVIELPASQITSMAFAGPGLDRLFVTSAADGVTGEALAGALFEVDAGGITGIAPTVFRG